MKNFAIEFPSYCINANRNKNEEKLRVNQVKNQFAYFGCILKHVKIEFKYAFVDVKVFLPYIHNGADKYVKYAVMYIFYAHRMVQKSINYGFMHDLESSA